MSYNTSNGSDMGSEFYRFKPSSIDVQIQAYENRLRERLASKYPSPTLVEARNLEKQIKKLVEIYAEGRILQQRTPTNRARWHQPPRTAERSRDNGMNYERG